MRWFFILCVVITAITIGLLINASHTIPEIKNEQPISTSHLKSQNLTQEGKEEIRKKYVIAHRGSGIIIPENTLMGFSMALGCGADIIHGNIRLNKDNQFYLFKDENLARITGENKKFNEITNEEIREVDVGSKFSIDGVIYPFKNKGLQPPTFLDWMIRFQNFSLVIEIEDRSENVADLLVNELRDYLNIIKGQGHSFPPSINSRIVFTSK